MKSDRVESSFGKSIISDYRSHCKNNVLSSTKFLLTTYPTVTVANKHICLLELLFLCLFSLPHPFYVATYTCIDKSDFQNVAVPTLYFRVRY